MPNEIIDPEISDEKADARMLGALMREQHKKMAEKRGEGAGGWHEPENCPVERLAALLIRQLPKGDPVDIANFAGMLLVREGGAEALAKLAGSALRQQGEETIDAAVERAAQHLPGGWSILISVEKGGYSVDLADDRGWSQSVDGEDIASSINSAIQFASGEEVG